MSLPSWESYSQSLAAKMKKVHERKKKVDKFFLTIVLILGAVGIAMFISASLGVLAKNKETFYSVLISQLGLGLGVGLLAMYLTSKINYKAL